jgi:predicted porin
MKKSLFAIAAVTAFAGAAQAQSSVTVYGILDVGYGSQTVKASGVPGATGAQSASTYGSTQTTGGGIISSAQSTSRIGLRGTEDLGGGMNAFFTAEFTITPTAVNNISGGTTGFNNRQTFVGVGDKKLGRVSLGTQYTPIHEAVGATDAGQQNNMPGNLIYPIDLSTNSANAGLPASNRILSATSTSNNAISTVVGGYGLGSNNYTNRAGNSVRYESPNIAGFVGKLFYTSAGSTTNQVSDNNGAGASTVASGGVNQFSGFGTGVNYTWKKLLVSANYQSFTQKTSAGTTTNATGINAAGWQPSSTSFGLGATDAALNVTDNQMYFGATYDFGILKAYAQYINRDAYASYSPNIGSKRTAQQIGVRGNVTPKIEMWASGATGKLTTGYQVTNATLATQSGAANLTAWQLGGNYWLSKRTNMYAIYGLTSVGNTAYPTTVAGTATNPVSNSVSAYALGLRHTF